MATAAAPVNNGANGAYSNGAGAGYGDKTMGAGGGYGHHGPMTPAEGYGPLSDDPVSYQRYFTKIANPGPMGMYAFAFNVFLWSFYLVHTRGVMSANLMIAAGLFIGGLVQFLAGMWEFPRGNVFGSTVFSMLGGFWFAYAIILLPAAGIASNLGTEFNNAVGLYYMVWFIITMLWLFAVLRRNISFIALFFFWAMTLLMVGLSSFTTHSSRALSDAGGALGFITAIIALYIATGQLIHSEMAWGFRMPLGHIGQRVGPAGTARV